MTPLDVESTGIEHHKWWPIECPYIALQVDISLKVPVITTIRRCEVRAARTPIHTQVRTIKDRTNYKPQTTTRKPGEANAFLEHRYSAPKRPIVLMRAQNAWRANQSCRDCRLQGADQSCNPPIARESGERHTVRSKHAHKSNQACGYDAHRYQQWEEITSGEKGPGAQSRDLRQRAMGLLRRPLLWRTPEFNTSYQACEKERREEKMRSLGDCQVTTAGYTIYGQLLFIQVASVNGRRDSAEPSQRWLPKELQAGVLVPEHADKRI